MYTVYCVVGEYFMVVDSCDVEWCGCGVLGVAVGPVMWSLDLFRGGRGLDGGAVSVRYDDLGSLGMSD